MSQPAEPTPPATPARPVYFTKSEAVARIAESESTVKKYLREGRFPNAIKDEQGQWRIPASDLEAAGLTLLRPGMQHPEPTGKETPEEPTVTLPLSKYTQLVQDAARAQTLQDLAWAWKTAHDTAQRQLPAAPQEVVDVRETQRRRLFQRQTPKAK